MGHFRDRRAEKWGRSRPTPCFGPVAFLRRLFCISLLSLGFPCFPGDAKTELPVRPSGERSPKDWQHGLLRTLTPAQRLSQRSRVSATANPSSFDRDSAKAHSE